MVALTPQDYLEELRDKFGWEEYAVFALVLSLSAFIGIFYGFISTRAKNNDEFLMGGRSMDAWPVALSIMCSFISALTVLGNPVGTYHQGTQYMTIIFTILPLAIILHYFYIPVYFKLHLTSAYQYFELRFHTRSIRLFLSLIHCVYIILYNALLVYGPSLALNQVTGFNTHLSVAIIFAISIFYSTLGGFRAVVWTDVLQAFVMIASVAVMAVKGTIDVGGIGEIWNKLEETERLTIFRADPDPRTRHSAWAVWIGGLFFYMDMIAGMQATIQRFSSMPTLKATQRSLWVSLLSLAIIVLLCTYVGVVIFVRFYHCDPTNANLVQIRDQIFPLFVMTIVGDIPGLPGLFVAGITCASLSSVSSGLNAMAAIVIEDYVKLWKPDLSSSTLFNISRLVSLLCGVVSFLFIFVVERMGDIFPALVSLVGVLLGPTLGTFSLGMMFPWTNSLGCLIGLILSLIFSITLGAALAVGVTSGNVPSQALSLSTQNCTEFFTDTSSLTNISHGSSPADVWKDVETSAWIDFSSISYLFLPLIATISTMILGLVCSALVDLFGFNKNPKPVRSDCLSPPFLRLWKWLFPKKMANMISESEAEIQSKNMSSDSSTSSGESGLDNPAFNGFSEKIKL